MYLVVSCAVPDVLVYSVDQHYYITTYWRCTQKWQQRLNTTYSMIKVRNWHIYIMLIGWSILSTNCVFPITTTILRSSMRTVIIYQFLSWQWIFSLSWRFVLSSIRSRGKIHLHNRPISWLQVYGCRDELADRYEISILISIPQIAINIFLFCRFFVKLSPTRLSLDLTMSITTGILYEQKLLTFREHLFFFLLVGFVWLIVLAFYIVFCVCLSSFCVLCAQSCLFLDCPFWASLRFSLSCTSGKLRYVWIFRQPSWYITWCV
jgi:hypothetical protein